MFGQSLDLRQLIQARDASCHQGFGLDRCPGGIELPPEDSLATMSWLDRNEWAMNEYSSWD